MRPGRLREGAIDLQPIGRIGKPEEIAFLALYLASATCTTDQIHIIDGGWTTSVSVRLPVYLACARC